MNDLKESKNYSKGAQFISDVANAPIVALLVFSLINFYYLDFNDFLKINFISILFAVIMPLIVLIGFQKRNNIHRDIIRKEDRKIPLLGGIVSYFLGVVSLLLVNAPPITIVMMFCYFANTILVMAITRHWKISIHSMGIAGPSAGLIFAFGIPGMILLLFAPLVMWSRVYLDRHTISQVIIGFFLGFLLTGIQMYLLLGLYS